MSFNSSWSNLARVVYLRTYSRRDDGKQENWRNTVDRIIRGNTEGFKLPNSELKTLEHLLINRKAGPAGRGFWFSGTAAQASLGGAALNNCFSAGTRIWADGKFQRFADLVGRQVRVMCSDGVERVALGRSFGVQALQKVSLKPSVPRSNYRLHYEVTPDHEWITYNRGRVTDLRVGDSIEVHARQPDMKSDDFRSGWVHGFVFGDGTMQSSGTRVTLRLCGPKNSYLDAFSACRNLNVTYPLSCDSDAAVHFDVPTSFKAVPGDEMSRDYQAGFVAGWKAADGSSRGRLTSTDSYALDWLCERAPLLGFCILGRNTDSRTETNFGKRNALVEHVTLTPETTLFRVSAIEDLERTEEVFCVTEPVTHSITLDGGVPCGQCWFTTGEDWMNFIMAQDLLMLGGGVGMSVEYKFASKLPTPRRGVNVVHKFTKDADFIVPDSREGWNELVRRTFEAYLVTGKGFSYSTVCIRPAGQIIKGFGGTASGPAPLISLVEKISSILEARVGKKGLRPIDAADILCAIGEMVVAGNVRRSAIIIMGDPWDKDYLKAKRWDLGPVPNQRAMANYSVVVDDVEDLHPLFWKTYENGEPFGIVNRTNIQKFGRMGELKKDTAIGVNPCAEATLEGGPKKAEPCNLQELPLPNLEDEDEFILAARMMHRWGKRVTMTPLHWEGCQEVVDRNRRVGTGITGCLRSPLFNPKTLDKVYDALQDENHKYSKELGIPESIRTTVVKPSGTISKVFDMGGYEGIHPAYSRHFIQRVRFSASDPLVTMLQTAGHHVEPVLRFDGTVDPTTVVVDFYEEAPAGYPVADEDWDTWKQLDTLLLTQKHWADQSVSVTVYYKKDELPRLKQWLAENLKSIKTISFLCHNDHGFKQAPKETISRDQYLKLGADIKKLKVDGDIGESLALDGTECEGGACPTK